MFGQCRQIFSLINEGKITPYISNIVLLEVVYTLGRTYKFSRSQIIKWLSDTKQLRNLTIIDKSSSEKAIEIFNKHNIKYGDCLIATQVPKGVILCTYDPDFKQIPGLTHKTPSEIIK